MKDYILKGTLVSIFILFLLVFFTIGLKAQSNHFVKGYVVLNEADTVHGTIELRSPIYSEIRVKMKTSAGEEVTYKPKDVVEYVFEMPITSTEIEYVKYERFVMDKSPMANSSNVVWLYKHHEGAIDLYYYLTASNNPNIPYHIELFARTNGESLININKENYKEVLLSLTSGNKSVSTLIQESRYAVKKVSRIIELYNNWMVFLALQ